MKSEQLKSIQLSENLFAPQSTTKTHWRQLPWLARSDLPNPGLRPLRQMVGPPALPILRLHTSAAPIRPLRRLRELRRRLRGQQVARRRPLPGGRHGGLHLCPPAAPHLGAHRQSRNGLYQLLPGRGGDGSLLPDGRPLLCGGRRRGRLLLMMTSGGSLQRNSRVRVAISAAAGKGTSAVCILQQCPFVP